MTREEADKLLEDLIVTTEWAASDSKEWRMYHKRACSLREHIIDVLCADPNAELLERLRNTCLETLGTMVAFPLDKLAVDEARLQFWQSTWDALMTELKTAIGHISEQVAIAAAKEG